jgi:hypothetical protein
MKNIEKVKAGKSPPLKKQNQTLPQYERQKLIDRVCASSKILSQG